MADLNIREVPEELMTNLKVYAASRGKTLKETVCTILANLPNLQKYENDPTSVIRDHIESEKRVLAATGKNDFKPSKAANQCSKCGGLNGLHQKGCK